MDKQSLKRQLEQHSGCAFVNKRQLRSFLGCGKVKCNEIVQGLEYLDGHTKRYLCSDVAGEIMKEVRL